MALIKKFKDFTPKIASSVYLSENATIIGEVEIGEESSVWFNAVLRGDVGLIRIGKKSNIQDGCVLHATHGESIVDIGNGVTVGHNAIVHGAKICDNALIGMGAIILDNAVIGENTIVAAGAVVTKNTVLEPNSIYAGIPAQKIKSLDPDKAFKMMQDSASHYCGYAEEYKEYKGKE